jgi:hypothetical protein
MVIAAAVLLAAVRAAGAWETMPAQDIPNMLFGCYSGEANERVFYALSLRKIGNNDLVEIRGPLPGEQAAASLVLRGAFQSSLVQQTDEAVRFRAEYRGNDATGVDTRLTVVMTAPQSAHEIRAANFTMVRAGRTMTVENCSALPPMPEAQQ